MNNQLFRIVTELDYKFDIELKDYFTLTFEERDELGKKIADSLSNNCDNNPMVKQSYIIQIEHLIHQSEQEDEYEKCDIFHHIQSNLISSMFP